MSEPEGRRTPGSRRDEPRPRGAAPRLGYLVVRDEAEWTFADWDGVIHNHRGDGDAELLVAKREEPLYEWYLAEVRPAEVVAH